MNNIKIKSIMKNYLYIVFLFLLVACEGKTSYYNIETCLVNYGDSKIEHINVLFSGQKYSIISLLQNEKRCFVVPVYSESSYSISLCVGENKYILESMGYYWSESNISKVNIFFENKVAIKNEPNNNSSNMEYSYKKIGKCQEKR